MRHVMMKLLLGVRVGVVLAMRVLVRVRGQVTRHVEVVVLVMVRLLFGVWVSGLVTPTMHRGRRGLVIGCWLLLLTVHLTKEVGCRPSRCGCRFQ